MDKLSGEVILTEKFNYILLLSCLFTCVFMYIDSYLIPLKEVNDAVLTKKYFQSAGLHRVSRTFEIETRNHHFAVTNLS